LWVAAGTATTAAGFALDHFEFRHAETLTPIASHNQSRGGFWSRRKPGKTRPIDSVAI
jgi:pantoate--beta-alanine ligase